jgi:hypothetical protein
MDEETERYDVDSPEFWAAFAKAWRKTVEDDRRLGLLAAQKGDQRGEQGA